MKITVITVVYNAEAFLADCIQSVISQTYRDIEYIVIDGKSTDSSVNIINGFRQHISKFVSEEDDGIYDAMNKGLALASGDVIGILNADDYFADNNVLQAIADAFVSEKADIVYGNLWYVSRLNTQKVVRRWISKPFSPVSVKWGWMPAHPTFYAKRNLFLREGGYKLNFQTAADYELMIRFLHKFCAKAIYLNKVFVIMRSGGVSNKSLKNRLIASFNDYKALKVNGIKWSGIIVLFKPLRKLGQFCNLP